MKFTPRTLAGLLYLLPGAAILGAWWILLFVGTSPGVGGLDTLRFVLSEGPRPDWFLWFLVLPFLFFLLAAAHLSRVAAIPAAPASLFALGLALAVASWLTLSAELALFATLPLLPAFQAMRFKVGRRDEG